MRRRNPIAQFANRRNLRAWLGPEQGGRTWQAVLAAQALPLSDCWQVLEAMAPINASLESFGIESTRLNSDSYTARYLPANDLYWCNTGDTYSTTIAFWHGRFRITTWGDIVERYERRPKEQTA